MEVLGNGARVVWILHGILGSGRNWRSFASRWAAQRPAVRVCLPDLRGHGAAPRRPPPHTLDAAFADLVDLPPPALIVGHSFGGKVALAGARGGSQTPLVVVDMPPGPADVPVAPVSDDPRPILRHLRTAPSDSRSAARAHLLAGGIAPPVVDWLLTSYRPDTDGGGFVYDFDAVEDLLQDTLRADFWPLVEGLGTPPITLVAAGRGGRWTPSQLDRARRSGARVVDLPDAGHWVQVDAPEALRQVLDDALEAHS